MVNMPPYEDITYAIIKRPMVVPNVYEYEIGNIDNYMHLWFEKLINRCSFSKYNRTS